MKIDLLSDEELCRAVDIFNKVDNITYSGKGNLPLRIATLNEELEVFGDVFKEWLSDLNYDNVIWCIAWGKLKLICEMSERFKKITCITEY
jgi:hypothetical protein